MVDAPDDTRRARFRKHAVRGGFPLFLLAVCAAKLFAVRNQAVTAIGWAVHDDANYVRGARFLLAGEWLGPFDQLTLLKGPGYPLWLALVAGLELPLLWTQHLLYLAACALLVVALRPQVASRAARAALFVALAFNPATYGAAALRVVRAGIYPALTLLVIAAWVGLHARIARPGASRVAWSIGLGAALAAFWITREEGVWILPLLLPGLAYSAFEGARVPGRPRAVALALCALPLALAGSAVVGVAWVNRAHYGISAVVELQARPFREAYGSLLRVTHARFDPGIALPRETRARIYAVSPAFAELRPFLEGPAGRDWGIEASRWLGRDPVPGEIPGDRILFAIREAVASVGHYATGRRAMAYYERLAREVNAACDDGRLQAGPPHASWLPPWRAEYLPALLRILPKRVAEFLRFEPILIAEPESRGSDANLAYFSATVGEPLTPRATDPPVRPEIAAVSSRSQARLAALHTLYAAALPVTAGVGAVGLAVGSFWHVRRRRPAFAAVWAIGLLAALAARSVALLYVEVTSFPTWRGHYLAPAYPVVLMFCFAGLLAFVRATERVAPDRGLSPLPPDRGIRPAPEK